MSVRVAEGGALTLTVSKGNWQGLAIVAPQMREHDLIVAARAHRQAWATARLQRRRRPDLPDDEGACSAWRCGKRQGSCESLLRLIGLDWDVPDFSTLSRRQKTLAVNIPHRGSQGPLHLLIDSTGIKVEGEGEWNARKHGGAKRRVWRKVHLGIDEQTLEIRAVEVTSSDIGDAPMLPELLSPDPRRSGDRQRHSRRRLRHAQVP